MPADANLRDDERSPKLGDEWLDWDGQARPDCAAPKRLFFALVPGVFGVLAAASLLSWYMITPRLAQWSPLAPAVLLIALAGVLGVLALALGLVALMVLTGWPRGRQASWLGRCILALIERPVFRLGRVLSIDRDRLAHAFIRTNNALMRLAASGIEPRRVLILLPRCLRKEQLEAARALARSRGVEVAVVAGGEKARQHIREQRPSLVIGVACERDLLSGIRDVRARLQVLGIANTRPLGPCRETRIDLDELKGTLELCLRAKASHEVEQPVSS